MSDQSPHVELEPVVPQPVPEVVVAPKFPQKSNGEFTGPVKRKDGRKLAKGSRGADPVMKQVFAKNLIKTGGDRGRAYAMTFPDVSPLTAMTSGPKLFRDPVVQEAYRRAGVDEHYLASRSRELMDSPDEQVAAGLVKIFVKPLLAEGSVQRIERVSVSLFGELNNGQIELIKRRKIIQHGKGGEDTGGATPKSGA